MLSMPTPTREPSEDIDPLQIERTSSDVGETNRLRYLQNSHVAISQLPVELLSDIFLHVIMANLQIHRTRFVSGTFNFLRVCRHWNEVAIGSPQLWTLWVPGAVKAWPLFQSRSKGAPLFLTLQPGLPKSALDFLADSETPRRIGQLDLVGTNEELGRLVGSLDSSSVSVTSSICLHDPHRETHGEHLTHFFSLSFPKLSRVDLTIPIPDPSSSIFTTSNLTSLKLNLFSKYRRHHTASRFSQILRQHPNLRELELRDGAVPVPETSGALAPVFLPQLVDLRLFGEEAIIAEFLRLVDMSSPLHNVLIHFNYTNAPAAARVDAMRQIPTAYYECQRLEYPRKVDRFAVSSSPLGSEITFNAVSFTTPASCQTSNLILHFHGAGSAVAERVIPLFPLKDIREFTTKGLWFVTSFWHRMLGKMEGLLHLQLTHLDIGPVLDAPYFDDGAEPHRLTAPNLQSLSLHYLILPFKSYKKLLYILEGRSDRHIGLENLTVKSCRVTARGCEADLREFVKNVTWYNVTEMGLDEDRSETEEDTDPDEVDNPGY